MNFFFIDTHFLRQMSQKYIFMRARNSIRLVIIPNTYVTWLINDASRCRWKLGPFAIKHDFISEYFAFFLRRTAG